MVQRFRDESLTWDRIQEVQCEEMSGDISDNMRERREQIVEALADMLPEYNNSVLAGIDFTIEAEDGFIYTIDPNDRNADGSYKLIVCGMYGTFNSDEYIEPLTMVCLADKIDHSAFTIPEKDRRKADKVLQNLVMPNLCETPPDDAFTNQYFMNAIEAPRLIKDEGGHGGDRYTDSGIRICHELTQEDLDSIRRTIEEAMQGVRVADKVMTTIDETSELYGIGKNRLRKMRAAEPDNPMFIYVNSKVLIKRKQFDAWLEEHPVFPY